MLGRNKERPKTSRTRKKLEIDENYFREEKSVLGIRFSHETAHCVSFPAAILSASVPAVGRTCGSGPRGRNPLRWLMIGASRIGVIRSVLPIENGERRICSRIAPGLRAVPKSGLELDLDRQGLARKAWCLECPAYIFVATVVFSSIFEIRTSIY